MAPSPRSHPAQALKVFVGTKEQSNPDPVNAALNAVRAAFLVLDATKLSEALAAYGPHELNDPYVKALKAAQTFHETLKGLK